MPRAGEGAAAVMDPRVVVAWGPGRWPWRRWPLRVEALSSPAVVAWSQGNGLGAAAPSITAPSGQGEHVFHSFFFMYVLCSELD